VNSLKLCPLIDEQRLHDRIQEIGDELTEKFRDKPLTAVCILKGSFIFYADLIRSLQTDVVCEFFGVSSYQGNQSSGEIKLTLDLANPVEDRHVILVEDIVDTGLTMNYLIKNLRSRKPKSLTTIALLQKPDAIKVDCHVDIVGFNIKNDFVVGYGLDYQGFYRNLPYVARVENMN
jgi:hypoxanthine phosphoribosyltransferase